MSAAPKITDRLTPEGLLVRAPDERRLGVLGVRTDARDSHAVPFQRDTKTSDASLDHATTGRALGSTAIVAERNSPFGLSAPPRGCHAAPSNRVTKRSAERAIVWV